MKIIPIIIMCVCGVVTTGAVAGPCRAGSLDMSGDPKFDSDSIASSDNQERRWLSYPGGRLCINPAAARKFAMSPMSLDLALNIGGYVGQGVVRMDKIVTVRVCDRNVADQSCGISENVKTTWYPYKMTFDADFGSSTRVRGCDFFIDADSTLIRHMEVSGAQGQDLFLDGFVPEGAEIRWIEGQGVLLINSREFYYALKTAVLDENQSPIATSVSRPEINEGKWSLKLSLNDSKADIAVAFGFSAGSEGSGKAVERALGAFAKPVSDSLAGAKSSMDAFLRKVPYPQKWGIQGVDSYGVTPDLHRREYYSAWSLVYQSIMNVFPEHADYPYPQMSLGKCSLWAEGEKRCPATCGWESFLALQWYALIDPATAWRAYEGIMSLVDEKGQLGGESLPSRKAQTAWVLHRRMQDRGRLMATYPAIKRYLLWREKNLRWLYGKRDIKEERDIEFVVSWLFDVEYAIRIAAELGMEDEVLFWKEKIEPMVANMRSWFFSDPAKLHQFYFVEKKKHNTPDRTTDRPIMTLTALCLKHLPADMAGRLEEHFEEVHKPNSPNAGFSYTKYPDNNLDAYGLIDRGLVGARDFISALLRDSIAAGEFAEVLEVHDGKLIAAGVKPSVFNALTVIEFTWLLNNVRYETGDSVEFQFGKGNNHE